jgi:predicted NAD/FAD-binding protein
MVIIYDSIHLKEVAMPRRALRPQWLIRGTVEHIDEEFGRLKLEDRDMWYELRDGSRRRLPPVGKYVELEVAYVNVICKLRTYRVKPPR